MFMACMLVRSRNRLFWTERPDVFLRPWSPLLVTSFTLLSRPASVRGALVHFRPTELQLLSRLLRPLGIKGVMEVNGVSAFFLKLLSMSCVRELDG